MISPLSLQGLSVPAATGPAPITRAAASGIGAATETAQKPLLALPSTTPARATPRGSLLDLSV